MKVITQTCTQNLSYPFSYPKEEILFFDIETTGFSPKTSALYLIGALYYKDNTWQLIQWFADDTTSEPKMLTAFFTFLQSFSYLIHFNGTTFDIPFLTKKCIAHHLDSHLYSLENCQSIDLYQKISPYKKKLQIPNLKQKTLEKFLNIFREDTYSGKELITFYQNYRKALLQKDFEDAQELEHFLLLHNHDDVLGMLQFSGLLYLTDLLNGAFTFESFSMEQQESIFIFHGTLPFTMPSAYYWKGDTIFLTLEANTLTCIISAYDTELKYFYDNPKEYYYLPAEDMAVHKSVATYVDKEFRHKATKATCYTRQAGLFLPVFSKEFPTVFQEDCKANEYFLLCNAAFLSDTNLQQTYMKDLLKNCPDLVLSPL